ncbi:hypothetical protein [Anaplasma phagocytophilum]|uniref:hypothetical protein n=1 Tax=Anaplasma phagocytophilum TaxID=948 RepID=UPI00201A8342
MALKPVFPLGITFDYEQWIEEVQSDENDIYIAHGRITHTAQRHRNPSLWSISQDNHHVLSGVAVKISGNVVVKLLWPLMKFEHATFAHKSTLTDAKNAKNHSTVMLNQKINTVNTAS